MAQATPGDMQFSIRRRYRARRLRLHPDRKSRSEKLAIQGQILMRVVERLAQVADSERKQAEELRDAKAGLARARADMDNLRKRTAREKEEMRKTGTRELIESLMPALDSFAHALAALEQGHDTEALAEGVSAIYQQLEKGLRDHGLERIDALGKPFDPNFHEGLAVEKTDAHPDNTVISVFQDGFLLHGRVIRPARVRVAQRESDAPAHT